MTLDINVERVYGEILGELKHRKKERFSKLVKVVDGELIIDWQGIAILPKNNDVEILYFLVRLGVLSTKPKGNFDVVGCGVTLLHPGNFYFTSKELAEKYKKEKWSNTYYPVTVYQV